MVNYTMDKNRTEIEVVMKRRGRENIKASKQHSHSWEERWRNMKRKWILCISSRGIATYRKQKHLTLTSFIWLMAIFNLLTLFSHSLSGRLKWYRNDFFCLFVLITIEFTKSFVTWKLCHSNFYSVWYHFKTISVQLAVKDVYNWYL